MGDGSSKGANMARKLTVIAESRMTFALSLLVLISTVLSQWYGGPTPYRDVEIVQYDVIDGEITLTANFTKTECVFNRLRVVAGVAGETEFLKWRDIDGLPENHDRNAGQQTLRIGIALQRDGYDWIEIRTRHDCDGEIVDKVFLHFDNVP